MLFVPPVQAHSDAIIFANDIAGNHIDSVNNIHSDLHHENDTEEEKNKEHHHHCISIGISNAIITLDLKYLFVRPLEVKKKKHFHKVLNTSSYLDKLFQPPKA